MCYSILFQDSLSVLQPLNREIRFTKFDVKIFNRNTGTILESTFRQYGSKQKLFLHFMVHEKIKEINVNKYNMLIIGIE